MKLALYIIGFLALIVVILFSFFAAKIYFSMKDHDLNLAASGKAFSALPHPPQSVLLMKYASVGLLDGNSNHCDYFVGEIRGSTLPEQEILAFYKGQSIPGAGTNDKCDVLVEFYKDGVLRKEASVPFKYYNLPDSILEKTKTTSNTTFYLVYSFDAGYNPGYDPRCY